MYTESKYEIIGRLQRTANRYRNAHINIDDEVNSFVEKIKNSKDLIEALSIEKEFDKFCKSSFPVNKNELLSLSFFRAFLNENAKCKYE